MSLDREFDLKPFRPPSLGSFGHGGFSIDADELALAALVLELDEAFDQCEERIVFAAADIIARLPFRAALASKDIAAKDMLAAELLEAETLCS